MKGTPSKARPRRRTGLPEPGFLLPSPSRLTTRGMVCLPEKKGLAAPEPSQPRATSAVRFLQGPFHPSTPQELPHQLYHTVQVLPHSLPSLVVPCPAAAGPALVILACRPQMLAHVVCHPAARTHPATPATPDEPKPCLNVARPPLNSLWTSLRGELKADQTRPSRRSGAAPCGPADAGRPSARLPSFTRPIHNGESQQARP